MKIKMNCNDYKNWDKILLLLQYMHQHADFKADGVSVVIDLAENKPTMSGVITHYVKSFEADNI